MAEVSQPLRITLPPLRITLNEQQQINLEWLTAQYQQQLAAAAGQTQSGLSDDWKRWIAENKLHNRPDGALVQAMTQRGIDVQAALQEVQRVSNDPAFQAGSNFVQLLRKLESILTIQQQLAELAPSYGKIERRERVTREEFLEHYYAKNRPVILTGMMQDWSAMQKWTPEYFKANYGQAQVEIQFDRNTDPLYEINCERHKKTVTLSEYVDMIVQGGESNNYYMVANNRNVERDDLKGIMDDIVMFPELLNPQDTSGRVFFWFGPAGTITPLHHDPVNLIMAHVSGRKRWRLISPEQTPFMYNYVGVFSKVDCENPDYNRYPLYQNVKIIEEVLEPGEIIFIPVGWWHQVKALDISLSMSFTNFVFPNYFNWQDPNIPNW
ncbi:cupin-like domain-containing protein [Desertifilum sp. FACHB-1129]|uniref:JmjC domain-containing protein n=2 Tax=Desertifilum tharense IPPAS B-1220 TaxID=1781255 RepID=A0A1E5QJR3_9CYAN|nr:MULTISPECIES: cupin-like domain-containing protein [Desertifilum]MCD8486912.1 cupin-like domain-containing protein [Desertifilum sp.]MDA0210932.1 cupin-like domain-containing protein [Cyanobacteria bacterium FC1]MBD2313465.1 cupin-like domain-containing protein [Desertifilum sp. FACHB-1129]MBD2322335.1 cupin-like domain-containing protein [Desertifilum sp. FACHB-866]MBD2332497.1 cupin-like domain-containing protein [Desertifilum sp. FACHB-868]